jgi:2-iminobutanoate/2-iminopropanoate deaminase
MEKKIIQPKGMIKPSAPYSLAVKVGNFVFASGQISFDLKKGEPIRGDIKIQTKQVLENLGQVFESAGASLKDVVRTTVYLRDLDANYTKMNEIYSQYFSIDPPARATIEVSKLVGDLDIEIDAIAIISD